MAITFEKGFQGAGDMRRNIATLIRETPKEVARATSAELQIEKRESIKITPWLTRKLQRSHRVIRPEIRGGRIYTGLTAGNEETASYDVIVHEDLEMFHPRGGEAKFLEKTWFKAAPHLLGRIARRVDLKRALNSTGEVEEPEE